MLTLSGPAVGIMGKRESFAYDVISKIFELATFDSYTKSVSYNMSQIEKKCFIMHAHSVNHLNKRRDVPNRINAEAQHT
jgi:hypothetical protein